MHAFKILAFLFCVLAAFASWAEKTEPVTFCRPNNMVSALLYIAEAKGFFARHHIEPTFQTTTNAKICNDMLLAGKAVVMTGAEAPFTYLAPSNPPVSIIAMLQRNPETAIFARKDRGIHAFSDLKGKRIGYLPGTTSIFFLERVLKKYGILRTEIKRIALQPPAMPQALVGSAIDAFSMWEPWGAAAMSQLGESGIMLSDPEIYEYEAILTARNDFLGEKPEAAKNILRALIDAENFMHQNDAEAFQILTKAIAFEPEVFKKIWPNYRHKVRLEDAPLKLMQENFLMLKEADENFKDLPSPDMRSFVNAGFLKAVAPERVSLDSDAGL